MFCYFVARRSGGEAGAYWVVATTREYFMESSMHVFKFIVTMSTMRKCMNERNVALFDEAYEKGEKIQGLVTWD
jgi:hypothetical protein